MFILAILLSTSMFIFVLISVMPEIFETDWDETGISNAMGSVNQVIECNVSSQMAQVVS